MKPSKQTKSTMRVSVTGKRFSRIKTTSASTPRDIRTLLDLMSAEGLNFQAYVEHLKEKCAAILRDSALPDAPMVYHTRSNPHAWTPNKPDFEDFSRAESITQYCIAKGFAVDSREHLAAQILTQAHWLANDQQNALTHAFKLGRLVTLLKVYDIVNIGQAKGGKKTAIMRRAEADTKNYKLKAGAKNIRSINPGMSNSDVARILSEREGLGCAEWIRKKLGKLLNE